MRINICYSMPSQKRGKSLKMQYSKLLTITLALLIYFALPLSAADKNKTKANSSDANKPSYELPQPAKENLDLSMYQQIRIEGLTHSHVMEYASALMDGIGPRLTGSPNVKHANEWTRDQLTAMGCGNSHLEDWGEFGMGWQQLNAWARMTSPDTAVFIVQASPWSPPTSGAVNGPATWVEIKDEKDFDKYKGKLGGKIVLWGDMREVGTVDKPLFSRNDDDDLKKLTQYPLAKREGGGFETFLKRLAFREKVGKFLADERALAVL